jgi:hypothetical protein
VTQQATQDEGEALDGEGATHDATEGEDVEEVTPSLVVARELEGMSRIHARRLRQRMQYSFKKHALVWLVQQMHMLPRKMENSLIDEEMKDVIACGAEYKSNEHYIATELFVKKEERKMFMTLPTNDIKFNWLSRKYNDKYENK